MTSFNILSLILLFLYMINSLSHPSKAAPEFLYHFCVNTYDYTPNSTYQTNLFSLLSSLFSLLSSISSNATHTNGFYTTTTGRHRPDIAHGLFLCRGDVTADVCHDCVESAKTKILQRCPRERTAIIWYDSCMLRYGNRSFFSVMEDAPRVFMWNTQYINERSRFDQLVYDTMGDIATRAVNDQSKKKYFATEEANFTRFQTLYSLVQCTADLSVAECSRCLRIAISFIPSCCSGKQGGRVLMPNCNVRFEVYPFYSIIAAAAPPAIASRLLPTAPSRSGKIMAIVVPIAFSVVHLFTLCYCFLRRGARKKYIAIKDETDGNGNVSTTPGSLQFDLSTIQAATNNFSDVNKIGEGGFGNVYKGILSNGRQIAVKRLSRSSGQGAEEFKNEVVLVAKLQHRNLVELLGFCLEGKEKIMVYEFVPNKSLNYFLLDSEKQGQLDWSRRYRIIQGIARGILYLHEDSWLRIIHRDLKASNILLDEDMNPKISDFGMARIFGVDQTQGNTSRIIGTYGYMSPEYAMYGQFSVKSDVYSFGVLVLEIICGKKNSSFYESDSAEYLLSYAWKLWRDNTPLELMDPTLRDSYSRNEVIRCIQIALLCIQEDPADRPTMASIVLMLNSFSVGLKWPRRPAFSPHGRTELKVPIKEVESDQCKSQLSMTWSVNEVSLTELVPR